MSLEPWFAHLCGVRPWEIDRLSVEQFERMADWVEGQLKEKAGG